MHMPLFSRLLSKFAAKLIFPNISMCCVLRFENYEYLH